MSPLEMCGILNVSTRRAACVPLPAPGGPTRIMRIRRRLPRIAQHLDVRDVVLEILVGDATEPQLAVELLEMGLRADPDRLRAARGNPAAHPLPPPSGAPP